MANPTGTHHHREDGATSAFNGGSNNGGGSSSGTVPESSSGGALKHNPGISSEWSPGEQAILEDGLIQYASESNINRYAKIAIHLPNKTVRDVALRCRWMSKKENSKRRKEENLSRKGKDRKERAADPLGKPSPFISHSNHPFASLVFPMDHEEGISYRAIDGVTGELLEQNAHVFNLIYKNISKMQTRENIDLLRQTRDNIIKILNDMNDMPEIMRQMPPLPVRLNEELANTILPRSNLPMK